jgi:hypothetical protein
VLEKGNFYCRTQPFGSLQKLAFMQYRRAEQRRVGEIDLVTSAQNFLAVAAGFEPVDK